MHTKGTRSLHIRRCKALSPKISQLECKCRSGKSINKFKQFDNLLNGVPNWDCCITRWGLGVPFRDRRLLLLLLGLSSDGGDSGLLLQLGSWTGAVRAQQLRLSEFKLKCHWNWHPLKRNKIYSFGIAARSSCLFQLLIATLACRFHFHFHFEFASVWFGLLWCRFALVFQFL